MRHLAAQAEEPENCILPPRPEQTGRVCRASGRARRRAPLGLYCRRSGVTGHAAADVVQIDFPVLLSGSSQAAYAKEERIALFQHMLQARAYVLVLGVTLPAY